MNTSVLPSICLQGSRVISSVLCSLALSTAGAYASNGTWSPASGGDWNNSANWNGGIIADGVDATATFATTIGGTAVIKLDAGRTLGSLILNSSNQWNLQGTSLNLAVSGGGAPTITAYGSDYHFIAVSLTGNQGLTKNGGGGLVLTGSNTYTGVTKIDYGKVFVRNSNSLGASGPGNEVILNASDSFTQLHFDSSSGDINISKDIILRRAWAGDQTSFYNDDKPNSTTLSGVLFLERAGTTNEAHTFGVQTAGPGRLTFAGGITGNLASGATQGTGIGSNIFRIKTGSAYAVADFTGKVSDGTIGNGGLSFYTDASSSGIVRLSAANTYSGSTVHNSGTLLINNTTGSGTGVGALTVKNKAILGGTGFIAPEGNKGITIESGAIVAPGGNITGSGATIVSSAGEKLTFSLGKTTGKATFASGAIIRLDASGAMIDSLAFTGLTAGNNQVVFSDNVVNLSITGAVLADGLYTIVSFDADDAYTGHLLLGTGFNGLDASLIYNADSIQLQIGAIPEPTSAALGMIFGLTALTAAAYQRRKAGR